MTLLRRFTPVVHRIDHAIGRLRPVVTCSSRCARRSTTRCSGRSPRRSRRSRTCTSATPSEYPDRIRPLVPEERFLTHAEAEWRRFDLYLNARSVGRRRACGAARGGSTSSTASPASTTSTIPPALPLGFEYYDRVAFINRDRMLRYLGAGIVTPEQAVLVGYPKLDRLATGRVRRRRDPRVARHSRPDGRRRSTRRPTRRPRRCTSRARAIVRALVGRRLQRHRQAARPVARSRSALQRRHRLARAVCTPLERAHPAGTHPLRRGGRRVVRCSRPPTCMVTDHSSVGFEYLVLDRPLIVFDAPDLPRAARINPEKIALLRSAATVVRDAGRARAPRPSAVLRSPPPSSERRRVAAGAVLRSGRAPRTRRAR